VTRKVLQASKFSAAQATAPERGLPSLQTERKPAVAPANSRYSVDADLATIMEEAGTPVNEVDEKLLNEPSLEKLTTENARLANETVKALPESPWYLAILTAAFVGILSGLLFLMR
jgi:hypothetical protein